MSALNLASTGEAEKEALLVGADFLVSFYGDFVHLCTLPSIPGEPSEDVVPGHQAVFVEKCA